MEAMISTTIIKILRVIAAMYFPKVYL